MEGRKAMGMGSRFLSKSGGPAEGPGLWRKGEGQTASQHPIPQEGVSLSPSHLRQEPAGQGLTRALRRNASWAPTTCALAPWGFSGGL